MKTFLRRLLLTLGTLLALVGCLFLFAPILLDKLVLPRITDQLALFEKSASIEKITPFTASGTINLAHEELPVASIPRFKLRFTPVSLLKMRLHSIALDHATLHLVKKEGKVDLEKLSWRHDTPDTSAKKRSKSPLAMPLAVDRIFLKQCSVILHESGQPDRRFTMSANINLNFGTRSKSPIHLESLTGTFTTFDSVKARGTFSLTTGETEHHLLLEIKTGLQELSHLLTGRKTSLSGTLDLKSSLSLAADSFQLQSVSASGEVTGFHLAHNRVSLSGGSSQGDTVTFTASGPLDKLSYSITNLHLDQPIDTRVSLDGNCSIRGTSLSASGIISGRMHGPFGEKNGIIPLQLSYVHNHDLKNDSFHTEFRGQALPDFEEALTYSNLSVSLPPASLNGSVSGSLRDLTATVQVQLDGEPFTLSQGDHELMVSGLKARSKMIVSPAVIDTELSLSIAQIKNEALELDLNGVKLDLPLRYPYSSPAGSRKGSFLTESIAFQGTDLFTFISTVTQRDSKLQLEGSIKSSFARGYDKKISGFFDLGANQATLEWNSEERLINSADLGSFLPVIGNMEVNGTYSTAGKLVYERGSLSGFGDVDFDLATVGFPEKDIALETISCRLEFPDLPTFATSPSQRCSIDTMTFGNLSFQDTRVDFRIEDRATVFIEKSSTRWCQGKLESTSLRLSRDNPALNTVLYGSRINFSDLLNQFGLNQAEGEGTLNGKLPVLLNSDGLFLDDGFLFSTPGTGGIIRFTDTEMLRQGVGAADVGGYLDYSMKAMEDFAYEWTKVSFNSVGEELLMTMELNGKPRTPLPYGFKNGMIVETEKGDGLQYPIQLDVNFRLPLADLFKIGRNLNAIKENM